MTYSSKFTHGGMDQSEAFHWDTTTYTQLGDIVFKLMSGRAELRKKAEQEYWQLKRFFMKDEFEDYIKKLDHYRIELGFSTITALIELVQTQEVVQKTVLQLPPENPVMPPLESMGSSVSEFKAQLKNTHTIEAVQLSLF